MALEILNGVECLMFDSDALDDVAREDYPFIPHVLSETHNKYIVSQGIEFTPGYFIMPTDVLCEMVGYDADTLELYYGAEKWNEMQDNMTVEAVMYDGTILMIAPHGECMADMNRIKVPDHITKVMDIQAAYAVYDNDTATIKTWVWINGITFPFYHEAAVSHFDYGNRAAEFIIMGLRAHCNARVTTKKFRRVEYTGLSVITVDKFNEMKQRDIKFKPHVYIKDADYVRERIEIMAGRAPIPTGPRKK